MRNKQLLDLYESRIEPIKDHTDLGQIAKEVRECVEAETLEKAVERLHYYQWGEPMRCAMALRGVKECPTCGHPTT